MQKMKEKDTIPSAEECFEIMRRHNMRKNIMRHSIRVRDVAVFIAARLVAAGHKLDMKLVEAAALLHDITKTRCLSTGERHAETGQLMLEAMGYHRVGQVVGNHVRLQGGIDPQQITENEVVNYADKRVMHHRIVSLDARYDDLRKRYGANEEAITFLKQMEDESRQLERKIFAQLNGEPSMILTLQARSGR
jgi:uncharacterized protein